MDKVLTLKEIKTIINKIKRTYPEGNDSHSCSEYYGLCEGLDLYMLIVNNKQSEVYNESKEITKELRYILNAVNGMVYSTEWEKLDRYRNSIKFLIKEIANGERSKSMKLYHQKKSEVKNELR